MGRFPSFTVSLLSCTWNEKGRTYLRKHQKHAIHSHKPRAKMMYIGYVYWKNIKTLIFIKKKHFSYVVLCILKPNPTQKKTPV